MNQSQGANQDSRLAQNTENTLPSDGVSKFRAKSLDPRQCMGKYIVKKTQLGQIYTFTLGLIGFVWKWIRLTFDLLTK